MAEGAALLVDRVLPAVGYRQWVLSFPGPMAVRLGYDHTLLARVAESLAQAVTQDIRRSVKERHAEPQPRSARLAAPVVPATGPRTSVHVARRGLRCASHISLGRSLPGQYPCRRGRGTCGHDGSLGW